ncbi:MAG: TIM barrel protein [Eubacteriales bacterium]|nr:TIM barrel protein [Eubacteriales bacterium]
MKYGVQLFGSHKIFNADPKGYIEKAAKMGYAQIEPCMVLEGNALPFAWNWENIEEYAAMARANGLELDSCHCFAPEFWKSVPQMIRAAQVAGFKRFVLGYRGDFTREALDGFAAHCAETADALAGHGLELWIHNNAREIAAQIDGVSAYEYILRACGGRLGAQVDTGWVECGGRKMQDFLEENAQYIRSIHHKDIEAIPEEPMKAVNVALGKGVVSAKDAHDFAVRHGLGQVVDQDNSAGDIMEDLAASVVYLKELD